MDKKIIQKLLATLKGYDEDQTNNVGEVISKVSETIRNSYDALTEDDALFLNELTVISIMTKIIDYQKIESHSSMAQATLEEPLKYAEHRFGHNSRPVAILSELINKYNS